LIGGARLVFVSLIRNTLGVVLMRPFVVGRVPNKQREEKKTSEKATKASDATLNGSPIPMGNWGHNTDKNGSDRGFREK